MAQSSKAVEEEKVRDAAGKGQQRQASQAMGRSSEFALSAMWSPS